MEKRSLRVLFTCLIILLLSTCNPANKNDDQNGTGSGFSSCLIGQAQLNNCSIG